MKVEVESKYGVGDKLQSCRFGGIYRECKIIEVEFNNGFLYLVEYENKCREWLMESSLQPQKTW